MQLNPSEISDLIKSRIKNFEAVTEARNTGIIVSLADGIVRVHGLSDALQGEMLEFPPNNGMPTYGLALNLERDSVGAVVLGDYTHLKEGDPAKTTGRILELPVGQGLPDRLVNAHGGRYDGKDPAYSGTASDTIAITGDNWAWDATIKMKGKVTQTTHGTISKDGQTMTLVAKTGAGNAVSTRVYHKQKK